MDGRTGVVQDEVSPEHLDSLLTHIRPVPQRWPCPSSLASMRVYTTANSVSRRRLADAECRRRLSFLSPTAPRPCQQNPWSTLIRYRSRKKSLLPSTEIHLVRYRACLVPDADALRHRQSHSLCPPDKRPRSLAPTDRGAKHGSALHAIL
jgi:hypothetical protein